MGDRIDWQDPYKPQKQGVAVDLMATMWQVFFDEGLITWGEYAALIEFKRRPMHLRHKPKTLPALVSAAKREAAFPGKPFPPE